MFDVVFFKQKTAYEMRISDWSSDVCSSHLFAVAVRNRSGGVFVFLDGARILTLGVGVAVDEFDDRHRRGVVGTDAGLQHADVAAGAAQIGSASCGERVCTDV